METEADLKPFLTQTLAHALMDRGIGPALAWYSAFGMTLLVFLLIVFALVYVRKQYVQVLVQKLTAKTRFRWDDVLTRHGCFTWAVNLGISVAFILLSQVFFGNMNVGGVPLGQLITTVCNLYFIVTLLLLVDSLLNAGMGFYGLLPISKDIEIKGFVQAVKLVVFLVGAIFFLSVLLGKTPVYFLSGIGALTAVLLLIFKDAILGLVAGIQISVNRTVRVGDWIEMPAHGADGDVTDISLTTVKIQNWDKTITSIPTYDLIQKSFKNWRGMREVGGRRIKRSLMIDLSTVRFADREMIDHFRSITLIRDYVDQKIAEIDAFNKENGIMDFPRNGRSLTNIGTFRAYCVAYLKANPQIHDKLTFLVRQLAPTSKGLPIEIYVFSKDTNWVNYEAIQSDIFDHLFAILPEFRLAAFQEASGLDVRSLGSALSR
ncbi:MAG: mechanosensitive ion channel domain-containing protein [Puniceicoccaceae bacterium]